MLESKMPLSQGVAQVDALIRLLQARKAGSTAAQAAAVNSAISRLRRTLLPENTSVR
jgi:hypothetical protein